MNMKRVCLILVLMMFTKAYYAQDELTPKELITQVMQSEEDYLYADQTCATVEQALERAQSILMREVEAYLMESGEDSEIVKGTITEQMVTITIQRGDKYRAFVYVNKSELSSEKPQIVLSDTVAQNPSDSVVVFHTEVATPTETDSIQASESVVMQIEDDSVLGKIATMTTRLQVYDYIHLLKKDGEGISFFEHPSAKEQTEMYLVIYRRGGRIEAVLTPPDEQGIRYNLVTGEPDSKSNYPATSVDGFIYEP